MTNTGKKGVPALRNEDVTGMTDEKQEEIARRTGHGSRSDAARKFNEEQEDQAAQTPPWKE